MTDIEYMQIALKQAEITLLEGGLPVGAVLTHGKTVIACDRKNPQDFHLGHAEMRVLHTVLDNKRIPKDQKFTLYTTIEPCVMCFGAILHCPNISRVVFALEDPWGGATCLSTSTLPPRHNKMIPEIIGGVLRNESKELVKQFLTISVDPFWNNKENNFVKLIHSEL